MPEEINRVLTDQIADLLFTTEKTARDNLLREGVSGSRIYFVGNVMIDTLRQNLAHAVPLARILSAHGAKRSPVPGDYVALTLHRPSNVDDPSILRALLGTIREISRRIPVIFPMHPRTRARIEEHGLNDMLRMDSMTLLPPLGYLEMLGLMKDARLVLTDSGGVQEETTALGVPCITMRETTERPITVEEGTNTVVGQDPARILTVAEQTLSTGGKAGRIPELWDGRASQRIVAVLQEWLDRGAKRLVA